MNLTHVHLLLNHFPTIGFVVGLGLFFVALLGRSEPLKRTGLVILYLMAVLSIATYVSGSVAFLEQCPLDINGAPQCGEGLSSSAVEAHEDAALLGFIFMEATGFFAWLGLWQFRRTSKLGAWSSATVLILSIITFGLMAQAANIGGGVRHAEIRAGEQTGNTETAAAFLTVKSVRSFFLNHEWTWPASETLHFVGLCLLFTVVLLVDLRLLGVAKSASFESFYQILPLGMLGFLINLFTGMLFFIATPQQYNSDIFYLKMVLVVLAGVNVLYFMLFDEPSAVGPGDDAPARAKIVAASAIAIWLGVLYYGHMLPFLGGAF